MMLTTPHDKEVAVRETEKYLLGFEQADCPVYHRFGPGIYIREVHLPANAFVMGHAQRYEHVNIFLKGAVAMVNDAGVVEIKRAPLFYIGKPGRKVGYVVEDVVWQNVYATEERDIDALEEMFFEKSESWHEADSSQADRSRLESERDRVDYALFCTQIGMTDEKIREQSENDEDQIRMPDGAAPKFTVRKSHIQGLGAFASAPIKSGEVIAPARLRGKRTPAGRYVNHSPVPNAVFERHENGDIYLVACADISGCKGGDRGQEITVDYRQALSLSGIRIEGLL